MTESYLHKDLLREFPDEIRAALRTVASHFGEMYVTGGAVRDWLSGHKPGDLDLTVKGSGVRAARAFSKETGGAFVLLDEQQGVARVVVGSLCVDFSSFREETSDINEDLMRRDFSINAMAIMVDPHTGTLAQPATVLDPQGGADDLESGIIRALDEGMFERDPLRLLRAFRFAATLGFKIDARTMDWIEAGSSKVASPAPERINYELNLIMSSSRAAETMAGMYDSGLLGRIFPELMKGAGLEQPASHHLDVLDHNLAALAAAEQVIKNPVRWFPRYGDYFESFLARKNMPTMVKWAALFHDLGKPDAFATKDDGRTTFYNHDRAGAEIFRVIAGRLRWSKEETRIVTALIKHHMYPFHLCNAMRKTGLTPRSCLRLVRAAGEVLPGLFILAMADSLASQGPLRPPAMEEELVLLFARVNRVYEESIEPVLSGPPLLDGNDLRSLGLEPGPLFGRILDSLEQAMVAGEIKDRQEAFTWLEEFLAGEDPGTS